MTEWDLICSASPNSRAVSQCAIQEFAQVCAGVLCTCVHALACSDVCAQTCCKALWMSMPCPQGAGGLARHSPALPLRDMSILCLLKFWKAVDMTFTPSYVRAPVYCEERADNSNRSKHRKKHWFRSCLRRCKAAMASNINYTSNPEIPLKNPCLLFHKIINSITYISSNQ